MKRTRLGGYSAPAVLVAACAGLLLLAGLYVWLLGGPTPPGMAVGGAWTLTRGDGVRVTDRDFRGRYLLLYFGYTSCPDVCPTTLAAVSDAIRLLGPKAARLQPLFITVDPGRDTPAVMRDYVRSFGSGLIGLTGTQAEIRTAEREYGVESTVRSSGPGGYAIDHTAVLILLGPDGRYLAAISPQESGAGIAERLAHDLS